MLNLVRSNTEEIFILTPRGQPKFNMLLLNPNFQDSVAEQVIVLILPEV